MPEQEDDHGKAGAAFEPGPNRPDAPGADPEARAKAEAFESQKIRNVSSREAKLDAERKTEKLMAGIRAGIEAAGFAPERKTLPVSRTNSRRASGFVEVPRGRIKVLHGEATYDLELYRYYGIDEEDMRRDAARQLAYGIARELVAKLFEFGKVRISEASGTRTYIAELEIIIPPTPLSTDEPHEAAKPA
jgi:hypothetical protein